MSVQCVDVISHGYEYTEGMRKGSILVDSIKRLVAIHTKRASAAQNDVVSRVNHLQRTDESMVAARKDPLVKHALARMAREKKNLIDLQSHLTKTDDTILTMTHAQEQLALTRKKNEVLESFTDIHSEEDLARIREEVLATTQDYETALDTTQQLLSAASSAVTMTISDAELEDEFDALMGITREAPAPINRAARPSKPMRSADEIQAEEDRVAAEMQAYLDMASAPDAPVAEPERPAKAAPSRTRVRVPPTEI